MEEIYPVHSKVSVNAVRVEAEAVGVDAGRTDQQIQSVFLLTKLITNLLDFLQGSQIQRMPLDQGVRLLIFDLLNSFFTLFLLTVQHDDPAAIQDKMT